jgi:large subunit ribosomal protein L23
MGIFKRKNKTEDKDTKPVTKTTVETSQPPVKVKPKKEVKVEETATVKQESQSNRAYSILLRPLISEKATIGVALGKYVFEVSSQANKVDIKKAIKEVYNVTPRQVNIVKQMGKKIRSGRHGGATKTYKKAIVTLKKGETIKLYEGI